MERRFMPNLLDFPARGKVITVKDSTVVFNPAGTTYQLHLVSPGYAGPLDKPVGAIIRVTARKVYTVPSGGNFIAPILGPPRIIQGRVKYADEKNLVVQAGANVVVDLPAAETSIDLDNGQIAVGTMVNVVALPGARFTLADAANPVPQTVR
jgi:hypothetical protein